MEVTTKQVIEAINRRDIECLLEAIQPRNKRTVRIKAAHAFTVLHDLRALPALVEALKDQSSVVRFWAARALGRCTTDKRPVQPLIAALLKEKDPSATIECVNVRTRIGDLQAVEPLLPLLSHANEWIRAAAADALGELGDARAIEPIVQMLKVELEEYPARKAAMHPQAGAPLSLLSAPRALGKLGSGRVADLLRGLLTHPEKDVRYQAAQALQRIGSPTVQAEELAVIHVAAQRWSEVKQLGAAAAEPLIGVLGDGDSNVQRIAATLLGELSDPRAIPPLLKLVDIAAPSESMVQAAAVEALARMNPPPINELVNLLRHPDARSFLAARGLALVGKPATPTLLKALGAEAARIRRTAADALGNVKDPEAIPSLVKALRDQDLQVRQAAIGALGKIGGRTAVEAIISALDDPRSGTQGMAIAALEALGDDRAVPALLRALEAEPSFTRAQAARALGRLRALAAVEPLLRHAGTDDENVQRAAQDALVSLGLPAVSYLLDRFDAADSKVRAKSLAVLGRIQEYQDVRFFIRALDDADSDVRRLSAEALRQRRWRPGTEKETISLAFASQDWQTLARFGASAVVPLLLALKENTMQIGAARGVLSGLVDGVELENKRARLATVARGTQPADIYRLPDIPSAEKQRWSEAATAVRQKQPELPNMLGFILLIEAEAHAKAREWDKAVECYRALLELNIDQVFSWVDLGYLYLRMGEADKAIDCYHHATELQRLQDEERRARGPCIVCGHNFDNYPLEWILQCPHCKGNGHSDCMHQRAEIYGNCARCQRPLGIKDRQLTGEASGLISGPTTLNFWGQFAKREKETYEAIGRIEGVSWEEAARRRRASEELSQWFHGFIRSLQKDRRKRRPTRN